MLDEPRRQQLARGDEDRQRTTRAREAAEALFAPKRPTPKALAVTTPPPSAAPALVKPRVLSASPRPMPRQKTEPAAEREPQIKATIPASQIAQIRTWLKYGMTIAQAAAVSGVGVDEIERALQAL